MENAPSRFVLVTLLTDILLKLIGRFVELVTVLLEYVILKSVQLSVIKVYNSFSHPCATLMLLKLQHIKQSLPFKVLAYPVLIYSSIATYDFYHFQHVYNASCKLKLALFT